jgi:hypothetical protein
VHTVENDEKFQPNATREESFESRDVVGRDRLLGFGNEEFELIEGARPVFAEEAGEGAVGEEFAPSLTRRAIVGFVGGVADALDF